MASLLEFPTQHVLKDLVVNSDASIILDEAVFLEHTYQVQIVDLPGTGVLYGEVLLEKLVSCLFSLVSVHQGDLVLNPRRQFQLESWNKPSEHFDCKVVLLSLAIARFTASNVGTACPQSHLKDLAFQDEPVRFDLFAEFPLGQEVLESQVTFDEVFTVVDSRQFRILGALQVDQCQLILELVDFLRVVRAQKRTRELLRYHSRQLHVQLL